MPTLIKNARANAGDLEVGHPPASTDGDDGISPLAGVDVKGQWHAAELLFFESDEDMRRWRGEAKTEDGDKEGLGVASSRGSEADDGVGDLFDLIIAADVVYLNDLWDAMAFTMKASVS